MMGRLLTVWRASCTARTLSRHQSSHGPNAVDVGEHTARLNSRSNNIASGRASNPPVGCRRHQHDTGERSRIMHASVGRTDVRMQRHRLLSSPVQKRALLAMRSRAASMQDCGSCATQCSTAAVSLAMSSNTGCLLPSTVNRTDARCMKATCTHDTVKQPFIPNASYKHSACMNASNNATLKQAGQPFLAACLKMAMAA
jgi:hypothetical protein